METLKAINWNNPTKKFYDDLYKKQTEQFWLPEEIPVSDDKSMWESLDAKTKTAYKKILAGLTLLDTQQSSGVSKIGEKINDDFVKDILTLFASFETIHARSYSTIFQTLCTMKEIEELFEWVEKTNELQKKVKKIVKNYNSIEINDKETLYIAMVGSLCLEGICFYSGFYLPLLLAGQGKMINSGEIINLILRDERLHTLGIGHFAQDVYNDFDTDTKDRLYQKVKNYVYEIYLAEVEYTELLYSELDCVEDVKTYIQFNVNYALECLGFEKMFEVSENEVNAVVMNGYSIETKTHDFFSTKGNGYIKTTKIEYLQDEDFKVFN